MAPIRITVTLDPEIVEQLEVLANRGNTSFDAALANAVRAGLSVECGEVAPYRIPSRPMGLRPGGDLTHALRLADSLDDEES